MNFNLKSLFVLSSIFLCIPFSALAQEADTAGVTDTIPPSDVENVRASKAGEGKITLRWDAATDDVGIKGYKIYWGTGSVQSADDEYDKPPVRIGNVLKKTIDNLEDGTTYYFAVTAVDKSGNESENYSLEASATTADIAPDIEMEEEIPKEELFPDPPSEPLIYVPQNIISSDYLNLMGVIKPSRTATGTVFYLNAIDGKRYYMMNKLRWREAVKYSNGDYKGKYVSVVGKPAYNRKGKLFGIFFSEITPVENEYGMPNILMPIGTLLQTGKIYSRRVNGKLALYLRSDENGKSYHLLNKPDWQKAVDFMQSGDRVNVYGIYVTNRRGRLFGIRYTDIVPASNQSGYHPGGCAKLIDCLPNGYTESPVW